MKTAPQRNSGMYFYKIITSDNFILYLATFIAGISIAYAITGWLLSSRKKKTSQKITQITEKSDLNFNENHFPNINAKNTSTNSFDNIQEESELIKSQTIKGLENECPISFSPTICDNEPNQLLKDNIKESFNSKYEELIKTKSGINLNNVSDLAAIILTDDNNTDWCETICITSGSDIISSHNLEPEFVLIDCRAATLARRSFIRYLYKKLNELVEREVEEENSLFTSIPASNRFELKKNIKVNLFLNQPPDCNTNSNNITNGPKNIPLNGPKKRVGKLIRLKSTTDKISLWNQVGIQGSILSHFIDPIFINSLIIAFDFNEKSIHRHFLINYTKEPKLLKCEQIKKEINEKSSKILINGYNKLASNWIQTEDYVEIIDCDSGKAISDVNHEQYVSRLSKHELNKCFRDFLTNYEYNLRPHQTLPMTYRKWKESAPNYRIQKQLLKVRYAVAGRQWNTMPSDLDMFI